MTLWQLPCEGKDLREGHDRGGLEHHASEEEGATSSERVLSGMAEALRRTRGSLAARVPEFVKALYVRSQHDRINGVAAEVAFFGVLSVFPGLLMAAAALGVLEIFVGSRIALLVEDNVIAFLNFVLTENASAAVAVVRDLFEGERRGILTLASLGAVVAVMRGFAAVMRALDLAYDCRDPRPWLLRRAVALVLSLGTVVLGAFVMVVFVSGPLLGHEGLLGIGLEGVLEVWTVVRWPLALVVLMVWATTVYHFAPSHHTPWSWDIPGGVVAALLWLVMTGGLTLYLRVAARTNPVLGALGGGLIMLIWLYLLSLALLIGGEVNAELARRRAVATG
jgi:membrane protein